MSTTEDTTPAESVESAAAKAAEEAAAAAAMRAALRSPKQTLAARGKAGSGPA